MQVHCQFCRNSFNLSSDYLTYALEQMDKKDYKYHNVECPRCRKTNKLPREQIESYASAAEEVSDEE